jgi:hypothetical protein
VVLAFVAALVYGAGEMFLEWIRGAVRCERDQIWESRYQEGVKAARDAEAEYQRGYFKGLMIDSGFTTPSDRTSFGFIWKTKQQVAAEFVAEAGKELK